MANELANKNFSANIWSNTEAFEVAARMATALSKSTIVPRQFQGNAGNCIIAIEMANRLKTSPMMVMQNLYIVNGNPSWSSQYIIAMINSSGRYKTELQFDLKGEGDSLSCKAFAVDHNDRRVDGPEITMDMAQKEGWVNKNGSKWKTMPEMMIRYRAASFFGRINCPDLIMGMYSVDEVVEDSFDQPIKEAESASQVQTLDKLKELISTPVEVPEEKTAEPIEDHEVVQEGLDLEYVDPNAQPKEVSEEGEINVFDL